MSSLLGLTEIRQWSSEEILQELLTTQGNDRNLKTVLNERRVAGETIVFNNKQPRSARAEPPWSTQTDSDLAKLGKRIIDSGWTATGMRDPENVIAQIRTAIDCEENSDNLIPEAQSFWVACLRRWITFMHATKREPGPEAAAMFNKLKSRID